MVELLHGLSDGVALGMIQAAGAIVLCVGLVVLCRWQSVYVERKATISIPRGLARMVLVGVVLALLLQGSLLIDARTPVVDDARRW
jgi:putative ABC transport system permease protein